MSVQTEDDPHALVLPDQGTGARARRRVESRRSGMRTAAFFVSLGVLAASIPILGYAGFRLVYESHDGRLVSPRTDPAAPGYEAAVVPTPTLLLVQHDSRGELAGMSLLSLPSGERGGAVLFLPVTTIVDLGAFGANPAPVAYRGGGVDGLRAAVARTLDAGIDQVVDIDDDGWASLVRPAGTVRVDNPDPVVRRRAGKNEVVFPAGSIELAPEQVGEYLSLRSEGSTEAARLGRQEFFWTGWLSAIGATPERAAVPGEADTGIGQFLRALAGGVVRYETLPSPTGAGLLDTDEVAALMADLVPLPVAPEPGARVRVRLLSGTADHDLSRAPLVTHALVQAGAEIAVVGNADRTTYGTSEVLYADPALRDAADELRRALGVGRLVVAKRPIDGIDVTIVLGADAQRETRKDDSTG